MKTRSLLLSSALLLGACGPGPAADFEAGFPTEEMVRVETPTSNGQGLTAAGGNVQAQGPGEQAGFYAFTRNATDAVNGATAGVLRHVRDVVRHPPTTLTENQAVWGPHSDALHKRAWRMTVTRVGEGVHEYKAEAKDKTQDDSTFVTVLSGTHTTAKDATSGEALENYGNGTFTIDFDASATLPEHNPNDMGKAIFTYSRVSPASQVTVSVQFLQMRDAASEQRIDANYRYASTPGEGGQFDFAMLKNIDAQAQLERMSIRSRWMESGAGRSDVRLTNGDMGGGTVTLNECWDTGFLSRYFRVSASTSEWNMSYGTEATDCAFQPASYFEE